MCQADNSPFSSNGGRDFLAVIDTLAELGAVDIAWRVFDSQYTGVPQQRRRIYLVADFGGQRAGEVLFDAESCGGHYPPGLETGEDPDFGSPEGLARALSNVKGGNDYGANKGTLVAGALLGRGRRSGRGGEDDYNLVANSLLSHTGRNQIEENLTLSEVAYSVQAREGKGPSQRERTLNPGGLQMFTSPTAIRRFTPVECERLQGFPDGWTCLCGAGADMFACTCPDGPRYRALGNAATTTVPYWIAARLARYF